MQPEPLPVDRVRIRVVRLSDAERLSAAYQRNREHLAPRELRDAGRVVGVMSLSGIVRGPFLSAHLGYWVDKEYNGRGVGSAAVAYAVTMARTDLGLHRLQAATLPHNAASQKILKRSAFEGIGLAPAYLQIASVWQNHLLYQRILF